MNEGLSQTDKDAYGKVDLELCFKRGLLEELGIHERLYRLAVRGSFYDFFLEKNNFEIGLSSVLEMELNFGKDIETLIGRDKALRSEEHTSELQSLMRISYAVFCLKTKIIRDIILADLKTT